MHTTDVKRIDRRCEHDDYGPFCHECRRALMEQNAALRAALTAESDLQTTAAARIPEEP